MAAIPVRNDLIHEAFDYSDSGNITSFHDAWDQLEIEDSSDFLDIPPYAILATMSAMIMFHIIASSYTIKKSLRSRSFYTIGPEGFYTLISPPLQYDWEFFYGQSHEQDTILMCWKRHA